MSTTRRLRTARIRLTLTYAAVMAAVLVAMAILILKTDQELRDTDAAATLLEQAQKGTGIITVYDDGSIDTDAFDTDVSLREDYPQLWVFGVDDESDTSVAELAGPVEEWFDVPLNEFAGAVIYDEAGWVQEFETRDDEENVTGLAYARGIPLTTPDGTIVGAVIAVADGYDWIIPHVQLRLRVFLIAGALVVVSAFAGYFLADRALRPARLSLTQQEQLIAEAAHELRTPVGGIRAAAEGGLAGDEPLEAALRRVSRVAKGAGTLLDDLLTLARMDAGQQDLSIEPLRLDLLVEAVLDDYVGIETEMVKTVVDGDAGLLRLAVRNLIANAVAHGASQNSEPHVTVTVYPAKVVVTDQGPGIDPEVADRIFDRFQSGKSSRGHGLGLPIAAWIAEAHGGMVTVENGRDGGVVATLEVPSR